MYKGACQDKTQQHKHTIVLPMIQLYKDAFPLFYFFMPFVCFVLLHNSYKPESEIQIYAPCLKILKQLSILIRQVEKIKYSNTMRNAVHNRRATQMNHLNMRNDFPSSGFSRYKTPRKSLVLKLQSV